MIFSVLTSYGILYRIDSSILAYIPAGNQKAW